VTVPMADLASAATAIEELAGRVAQAASEQLVAKREDIATELYSVESAMMGAARRLRRVADSAD
jgi:hypothetical protein